METSTASPHKGFRFRTEIIAHAMWLYHRFPLSVRDVEELRFVRGIVVTYETIRHWCKKFGPAYANQLRRRRRRPADISALGCRMAKINAKQYYLWRALIKRQRTGQLGPAPAQQGRRKKGLPQTPQGLYDRPAGDYHGQARQLRGRTRSHAW